MSGVYRLLFDLVLRRMDPERAHHLAFTLISAVGRVPGLPAELVCAAAREHR